MLGMSVFRPLKFSEVLTIRSCTACSIALVVSLFKAFCCVCFPARFCHVTGDGAPSPFCFVGCMYDANASSCKCLKLISN